MVLKQEGGLKVGACLGPHSPPQARIARQVPRCAPANGKSDLKGSYARDSGLGAIRPTKAENEQLY